tara:strand:+ start:80 stop:544 length:465 start_codon:yes stop_codon:yes gene_type:complete
MSSSRFPGQGPNFVPAYQVSGIPYVTSSAAPKANTDPVLRVSFPNVTKSIMVKNTGDKALRVSFTKSGSYKAGEACEDGTPVTGFKSNYFVIPPCSTSSGVADAPPTVFDVRCKEIFFRSDEVGHVAPFSLYASLTGIEQFPVVTGSKGFKGVG